MTAVFCLALSRKGAGEPAWGPILLLNAATALFPSLGITSGFNRGWRFGRVMAHRFSLILPVSPVLAIRVVMCRSCGRAGLPRHGWPCPLLASWHRSACLQIGIGRCDPYTVMVTTAALPALTFAIEAISPAYAGWWLTALGVAIVWVSRVGCRREKALTGVRHRMSQHPNGRATSPTAHRRGRSGRLEAIQPLSTRPCGSWLTYVSAESCRSPEPLASGRHARLDCVRTAEPRRCVVPPTMHRWDAVCRR